jgi:hypothetical protein
MSLVVDALVVVGVDEATIAMQSMSAIEGLSLSRLSPRRLVQL